MKYFKSLKIKYYNNNYKNNGKIIIEDSESDIKF